MFKMKVGAWTNSAMLNSVVLVLLCMENNHFEQILFKKTKFSAQNILDMNNVIKTNWN